MKNKININNIVFVFATSIAAFSILFFIVPNKIARASDYIGSSYGGDSYGGDFSSGQDLTGTSYSDGGSYNGDSSSPGQDLTGVSYSGSSHSSGSYGGVSYSGSSYSGTSQVAAVAYAKCEPYLKFYLGYGKNNNSDEVQKLQEFLNKYQGEKLIVTKVFDELTLRAVKRFQDKYAKDILKDSWGLSCNTGYVYITTLAKVNDIVCNTATDFSRIPLPNPRPVYYCSGVVDSVTKQAVPCTAVTPPSGTSAGKK